MNGVFFGKMNLEIKATIFWPCQKTLEEHSAFILLFLPGSLPYKEK